MSNKNILYLSYDGMTDPLGQSQVLPYIVGIGKQVGCKFYLISCEKEDRFLAHEKKVRAICNDNNIEWHPLKYNKKPPILSTVFDLYKMRKLAEKLHKENEISVVHCRAQLGGIIGLYLKKKYNIPIINDIRGFWADEKVDAGAWDRKNIIYNAVYKYFKKIEKNLILKAEQQVCLTYKAKDEIATWPYVKNTNNITIIPCCADVDLFSYSKYNDDDLLKTRERFSINKESNILAYLGSIGSWYMLNEMLDFFKCYQNQFKNAQFLFITFDGDEILDVAQKKGISAESIIIRGAQRDEVPTLLSISNASVFFIRPCYSKISSSPTKQGEIMSMGVPLFCNSGIGDTDMIVEKYNSGILVEDFSNHAYTKAIEQFKEFNNTKENIRKGAIDYFSLDNGVNKYVELYKRILN